MLDSVRNGCKMSMIVEELSRILQDNTWSERDSSGNGQDNAGMRVVVYEMS